MKQISTFKYFLGMLIALIGATNGYAQCSFTGLNANYCTNSPTSALTPSVGGGTFTGPGVTGFGFDPALAGAGTHTITYSICQTSYVVSTASFAPSTTLGTQVSLSDDSESGALPIGFNFVYFCTTYNTFYVSSNGFIEFSLTGNGCCQGQAIPTGGNPSNFIAYCWTDLNPGSVGSRITYTTLGLAPNRVLVVSFNQLPYYNGGNGPITSQIKLFETSNIIEIHNTTIPANTGYTKSQGIENLGGTIGYAVAGRNANTSWTATNDAYRFTPGANCSNSQTTTCYPSTISIVGSASICSGATTTLTALGNTTYSWNINVNTPSIAVSPTVNTTYAVAATNAFGCVASSAITITVDTTPTVTAVSSSGSGGVCPNSTVSLSGAGATSYSWTGGISNGVPFSVSSLSNYTVTGLNACGSASAATAISIHPLPNVTAVAGQPSVCSGNPVSLTGVGNATNYVWSNNVSNGGNIFPGTTANYTVVGTSALGCTAQAVVGVTVVTTPQNPPIPNPPLICFGSTVALSSSGATNYTWTTPTGQLNTANIVDSPTITTTYTLTKSNANCVNTQTVNVIVNNLPPVSAIVNPTIVCASKPATLNAAGAANFTWTSGPPTWSATGAQISVSPSVSTLYTVTASDGTCVNTTTIFLPTNPNPTITIVPSSTAICYGQTATLTVSGANNYSWTTTSITSNTNSATIVESPLVSTLYNVIGENSFSCTTPFSQVLVVHPNPTLTISSNKPMVCEGAAANLTVTGANTYQWDANAGNATSNIVQVNPLTSTIYTVAGTYSTTQCSSTKTILTTVFLPTFAVNSPTSSCLGGTINLIASGATSYTWNGTQPFSQIAVSPPTETVYVVAATSISLGVTCISTRTVLVSIYNNPTITAVAERTMICREETTDLIASGAQTYVWNTNQTGSVVPVGPFNNTTYTVTGTDQNGCVGNTTVVVRVSTCFGVGEFNSPHVIGLSVFPNPNNGSFELHSKEIVSIQIINELGQLVQTLELNANNDYHIVVTNLAKGVYFLRGQTQKTTTTEKLIVGE